MLWGGLHVVPIVPLLLAKGLHACASTNPDEGKG
eukprot:COSAG04_NODE_12505_length_649_cov_1.356364_1_plen_33_part_10